MLVSLCGKHVYTSSNFHCALWSCAVVHTWCIVCWPCSYTCEINVEINFNHVHKHMT